MNRGIFKVVDSPLETDLLSVQREVGGGKENGGLRLEAQTKK